MQRSTCSLPAHERALNNQGLRDGKQIAAYSFLASVCSVQDLLHELFQAWQRMCSEPSRWCRRLIDNTRPCETITTSLEHLASMPAVAKNTSEEAVHSVRPGEASDGHRMTALRLRHSCQTYEAT
jgi:hypothetical protein